MQEQKPSILSRFSMPTKIGFFVALGSVAIWVGGKLIDSIEPALPWTLGAGVVTMGIGIYLEQQKKNSETSD